MLYCHDSVSWQKCINVIACVTHHVHQGHCQPAAKGLALYESLRLHSVRLEFVSCLIPRSLKWKKSWHHTASYHEVKHLHSKIWSAFSERLNCWHMIIQHQGCPSCSAPKEHLNLHHPFISSAVCFNPSTLQPQLHCTCAKTHNSHWVRDCDSASF